MGNTRPHDKDNRSTFPFLQQKDGFDINIGQDNGGGNFMPLPNSLLLVIPPVESMKQETRQTGGRTMVDFMMHNNSLQNPRIDAISKNMSSNQMQTYSVSDVPFPEFNVRGVPHYPNQDFMMMAQNAMNRADLSSTQGQPTNRNFMLRRNAAGGYQMVRKAGEARHSNINPPQINGDFGIVGGNSYTISSAQNYGQPQIGNPTNVDKKQLGLQQKAEGKFGSLGDSASMLSYMQNREHTQTCDIVKVRERLGVQEQIDGSFLSLGIGGNQTISKPKYSSHENAAKLEEAAPPSHVQQTTRTFLDSDIPSFQTNVGGFLNPMHNADSRTLSSNDVATISSTNGGTGSSPFQVMQRPQYAMQQEYIPMPSSINLSSVSNRNVGYPDFDYRNLQNNQPGPAGELGGNSAGFLSSRQVNLFGSASESAKPAVVPSRTPLDMHNLYVLSAQRAAESAVNSPSLTLGGSSTRSIRPGPSITGVDYGGSQAAQNSGIPQSARAQPPGQLLYHKDIPFQAVGGSLFSQKMGAQGAVSGLFPKRLGVEVNANGASQVAQRDPFCSEGAGLQTAGNLYQPSETRSNLLPNNFLTPLPPPIGWPEGATRIQYPTNLHGSTFVAGRSQDVPGQFSNGPPGFASMNGQVVPPAAAHRQPSLKRSAMGSPPAPRWVQRQKIMGASTVVHPPKPTSVQAVSPIQKTDSTVSRIKWEGSDATPQPTGERCYICKRDVSFTAEGPVYQPTVPPAVAVLPCGHTFHDQCLQNITPEDQSKEPPCIPCAIGEI